MDSHEKSHCSNNTNGSNNMVTGAFALTNNTTGFNNTATGANALIWGTYRSSERAISANPKSERTD